MPRLLLFTALLLAFASHAADADKKTYLADVAELLKKEWPRNRLVNIVCHGHSVPAGYFKTPHVDTFNAYPHLFHKAVKERFPLAVVNVIVTAIGGEDSISGAARFEKDVLVHKPDVLLIDYALNDRRKSLDQTRAAWSSMIEKALAQKIKVILLTPTGDTSAKLDDSNDPLNKNAEQIRALAKQYGVGLADSLDAIKQHIQKGGKLDELMSQINHPNRKGHDLVVERLMEWVP